MTGDLANPGQPNHSGQSNQNVAELLGRSRRDLLDLTLRNPLLSFRSLKAKGADVVDELPPEVFRMLVAESKSMYFQAAEPAGAEAGVSPALDDAEPVDETLRELLELMGTEGDPPADRHLDNRLQTAHDPVRLEVRLRNTMRHAASSIEEQGVNILYLALGMLRWYESDSSDIARMAPLLLVPVGLSRASAGARFKVAWTGEEVGANLSLAAKLRTDFQLALPDFEDGEELDVSEYFRQVDEAVGRMDRWAVDARAVHLGFFSFSKLLIYQDLDPGSWPEDQAPQDHPVVGALYGSGGFAEDPPSIPDDENLDDHLAVADMHNVLDSDSSQNLAIVDAQDGRNLVVQGPPGTGKSQMITNLIAEAVARDKTVLFVAEKLAALKVVKRRLDSVHVGDACLELHSHTANKRTVLDELKRTMALGEPRLDDSVGDRALLEERRKRLNDYSRAVNAPVGDSGLSPNALIGRLAFPADRRDGAAPGHGEAVAGEERWPRLEVTDAASWSREQFVVARENVREVQSLVAAVGRPRDHPYWGSCRRRYMPTDERAVAESLAGASAALRKHRQDAAALWDATRTDAAQAESAQQVDALLHAAKRVIQAPDLRGADCQSRDWVAHADRILELAHHSREMAAVRSRWEKTLIPEAWDQNVLACRQDLAHTGDKAWRWLSGRWRRARRVLHGLCRTDLPGTHEEQVAALDAILRVKRLRGAVEREAELAARLFPLARNTAQRRWSAALCEPAEWLVELHREVEAGTLLPLALDLLDALHAPDAPDAPTVRAGLETAEAACRHSAQNLADALAALAQVLEWDPARFAPANAASPLANATSPLADAFPALERWLADAAQRPGALQEVVRFNQIAARLAESRLESVAETAARWPDAGRRLARLYERHFYRAWLERAFRERPVLAEFDGTTHEGVVERFRKADSARLLHNQALVAKRHWERVPRSHGGGQLGLLRREFEKKRRHLPLRKLMSQAGNAVQGIKPVFMMSPLSIAKFIPPGTLRFDMVIFDEASQVRPVDALGAVMRGRQTVVVGDSKQLPPTTFFDRAADEDDGEQSSTADLESILGMFCAQGAPERMLRWHYRSRHESLIAVSNHEFYDNGLVVFPSPDRGREDTGVVFQHGPETHYKRGRGGRINPGEARDVAQAVMEHAATRPHRTLGVAAFSLAQARRIEDELEILRRKDPSAEAFFARHPQEPFFVKNLENVQGDERDVILISVGYGKTEGGHLPMNFGPLNRDGGERRLNVLITRARRRCLVYSNFVADDLDLRRSNARGVDALKTYLKYAETGRLGVARATGADSDSPFEDAVAAELRAKGHDVEHQVGSAGFRIDLAVVDPVRPGRYLIGIECDGAAYHSARSARDRDRLRQQVLEGLGWTIHRIWSTDWFRNPSQEVAKAEEAIRRAAALSDGASPGSATGASTTSASAADVSATSASATLERASVDPADEERTPAADPYQLAQPTVYLGGWEFHEVPESSVLEWVKEVVDVESPVHLDEAAARVAGAAGLQRVGSRIRSHVAEAVELGVRDGVLVRNGGFLWRLGQQDPRVRGRGELPNGHKLRSPEMIAPEEIGAALRRAIETSYGISSDDAVAEACRLMGFRRRGAKLARAFARVLDSLVRDGVVEKRGQFLQLAG